MPKRMSKGFFLGGYFAGLFASIAVSIVVLIAELAVLAQHPDDPPLALIVGFAALCLVPLVFSLVIFLIFVHRMWAAIQDSYVRMTPGKAVGFLLIPVFNFYWLFHVFHGFAYDYNQYIARRQLKVLRLDEQLFRYYPIAVLCTLIPLVGAVLWPIGVALLAIIMIKTCDAVNALAAPQALRAVPNAAPVQ